MLGQHGIQDAAAFACQLRTPEVNNVSQNPAPLKQ